MSQEHEGSLKGVYNEGFEESRDTMTDKVLVVHPKHNRSLGPKSVSIDPYFEPSSIPSFRQAAVSVKNGNKSYTSKMGTTHILKDFNMTVKQGTIYSLLGASGCGKTTLLSCMVNLKKLNSGDIFTLGARPGTKGNGVPGKRVGYMPQELALFTEFSIYESLNYYGRIYRMVSSQIEENITFLIDFLKLPPGHRRVASLSGGQRRRVSLACSLIHNPELLLLDEPTVGVDALLRNNIWNHLVNLVSTGKTTVIITTHYIEEARQSNTIGLMRNGKLLVEDSPGNLLRKYKTNLLEDVVMILCLRDSGKEDGNAAIAADTDKSGDDSDGGGELVHHDRGKLAPQESDEAPVNFRKLHRASVFAELQQKPGKLEQFQDSMYRIVTLVIKNVVVLLRNLLFLVFISCVPAMQVFFICLAVGGDPKDLKFGVVNYELALNSSCPPVITGCPLHDNFTGLMSCWFLQNVDPEYIILSNYYDEDLALEDVKKSKIWGVATFPCNYTESFKERALFGNNAEMGAILASRIGFQKDSSNKQIDTEISKYFFKSLKKMMREVALDCGLDPVQFELPINLKKPVYGNTETDFTEFIAPSVLLGILFFFPLSSSGLSFIGEKRMGTFDRGQVAGVTTLEFMLSYTFVQIALLIFQTFIAFVFLILVFDIKVNGPLILPCLISLLVGMCGISVGFVISTFCPDELQSVLLSLGLFFPNLLLSGMIWPIEAMPVTIQYIAYALPCYLACATMRSVVSRGVGMTHPNVWPGFIAIILWIFFYLGLFVVIHKMKSHK